MMQNTFMNYIYDAIYIIDILKSSAKFRGFFNNKNSSCQFSCCADLIQPLLDKPLISLEIKTILQKKYFTDYKHSTLQTTDFTTRFCTESDKHIKYFD